MMLHQSKLISLLQQLAICSALCAVLLARHTTAAGDLGVGSRCSNDSDGACIEGLVCAPVTPGSADYVCKDSNHSSCENARCPRIWCPPSLQYVPEGECCPKCPPPPSFSVPTIITPSCFENGVTYQEGETWARDACTTCSCEAGLPLCRAVQCELPEGCAHLVMVEGDCCPTCATVLAPISPPQCEENGQTYQDGDSWKRDSCTTCFCAEGLALCAAQSCYVECENPVYSPDKCCPECPDDASTETSTSLPVPIATSLPSIPPPTFVVIPPTTHCEDGDQVYENGATWNKNGDACTSCTCEEGFSLCIATACHAACQHDELVFLPGVCCPLCPGDEGYPTNAPSESTNTLSPSSSSETTSTTVPPTIETSSEQPSVISTISCKDESGVERPHGESWCPKPQEKATCQSGIISYSDIQCPAPVCSNPTWIPGSCDCPVCPDVEVSVVLDMEYSRYLKEQDIVKEQLVTALDDFGVQVLDIQAESYSLKQTQMIISLAPLSEENKVEWYEAELEALLLQMKYPTITSLKIGHHTEESKSIENDPKPVVQSSASNSSGGPDKTATVIAVSLTAVVALVSLLVILVVVTRVRKLRAVPKTTVSV